jgi:CRISPR/Cas system-associated protein Csm6
MPLIDSIEGYGFKFNKERGEKERQTKELHDLSDELVNRDNYSNIAELNSLLRNLRKENKDE